MEYNVLAIAVMAAVTMSIRIIPIVMVRGKITNPYIKSFLFYMPYVTLAVMTFPAIVNATQSPLAGLVAFIGGIILAWYGGSLFQVAVCCCVIVFIMEFFLC